MEEIQLTEAKSLLISDYMVTTNREYTIIYNQHLLGLYRHLKEIGLLGMLFNYHDPEAMELVFNELQRNVIIAYMEAKYEENSICTDYYIMEEYSYLLQNNLLHELFEY
jgi:hypothetical protein